MVCPIQLHCLPFISRYTQFIPIKNRHVFLTYLYNFTIFILSTIVCLNNALISCRCEPFRVAKLCLVISSHLSRDGIHAEDVLPDVLSRHLVPQPGPIPQPSIGRVHIVQRPIEDVLRPGDTDGTCHDHPVLLPYVEAIPWREDVETNVQVVGGDLAHATVPVLHNPRILRQHLAHDVAVIIAAEDLGTLKDVFIDVRTCKDKPYGIP